MPQPPTASHHPPSRNSKWLPQTCPIVAKYSCLGRILGCGGKGPQNPTPSTDTYLIILRGYVKGDPETQSTLNPAHSKDDKIKLFFVRFVETNLQFRANKWVVVWTIRQWISNKLVPYQHKLRRGGSWKRGEANYRELTLISILYSLADTEKSDHSKSSTADRKSMTAPSPDRSTPSSPTRRSSFCTNTSNIGSMPSSCPRSSPSRWREPRPRSTIMLWRARSSASCHISQKPTCFSKGNRANDAC